MGPTSSTLQLSPLKLMNAPLFAYIDWAAVSGVTGIVSAVVAVISLVALFRGESHSRPIRGNTRQAILFFLLFSSAWALLVIAFNWIFEPFGAFLSQRDERVLYGIMFGVPSLILAGYALNRLGLWPNADASTEREKY